MRGKHAAYLAEQRRNEYKFYRRHMMAREMPIRCPLCWEQLVHDPDCMMEGKVARGDY